jgi:nucleotide-binding universal stress UspA family protein
MFAPKNILVPTDFSEYSDRALMAARDIALPFHARVYLLHVIDEGFQRCITDYCPSDALIREIEREETTGLREKLEKKVEMVGDNVEISLDIRKGVPYEEILKEQKEKGVDLIVLASHGRTGLLRHLIGSVAEKVMRSAPCPVLMIRAI